MFTTRTEAIEFSATGAAQSTSKSVASRRLQDNVGYIAITNLDDPKVAGEVRKAVEEMKTADGVILDLRGNQGGSDSEVPALAGLFVKPGTPTGSVVTPEGKEKTHATAPPPVAQAALPSDKPVVVLVDRNTASSAETLAGSLKESKRAVLVGEKTYGKGGVQMPKLLPGGAIVLVVGAERADLKGNLYSGNGLKPDVPIEGVTTGSDTETDPAVRKAREVLRKPQGPGTP
jgi:carboxyl-terminal processing protease